MNFLIIGGFLGSGKTSLLLQLASYMREKLGIEKTVILENEIGEVGIDDRVLSGAGCNVRSIFAGCVCCTISVSWRSSWSASCMTATRPTAPTT